MNEIYGKLTIKMVFFIPSRNPAKPSRGVQRTLHTEHQITCEEAIEFSEWFKKENDIGKGGNIACDGNPFMSYEWQAYPEVVAR